MRQYVHRTRRHVSLVVSISLVLLLGAVGLWAGGAAGTQAMSVHEADRVALQQTLGDLTGQYSQVLGAELIDIVSTQASAGVPAWTGRPGNADDADRLRQIVRGSRALDAGAVLLSPAGTPLNASTDPGRLPSPQDPGWAPFRRAIASGERTLPVSDELSADGEPVVAVAVPVGLPQGTGLLVGLSYLRTGALQRYVEDLVNADGRRGYVVDGRGLVLAAPTADEVGRPLRYAGVLQAIRTRQVGFARVESSDGEMAASFAPAKHTSWTALTVQGADRFSGALDSAARRAKAALVALLLIAGTSLLVLHRKREAALRDVAVSDELTGLYNRRGWFAVAAHEIERARRTGERRGLLFIDVDGLKQVNDLLGHREGDRAIVDAAEVLRGCARSSDVLGRLGGDEFVLLLGQEGDPHIVRARVLEALEAHNAGSGARFELRLSIGGEVWYPDDAITLDELVQRADGRMYADKTSRPSRHEGLVRAGG
jgi:diguanylate cyclase (GGDEF)-like protein